jgi:hypothetical protein
MPEADERSAFGGRPLPAWLRDSEQPGYEKVRDPTSYSKSQALDTAARSYRYAPRWGIVMLSLVAFGFGGIFFVHQAQTNDRGLSIEGLVLNPRHATIAYGVLAIFSFAIVAAALFSAIIPLFVQQEVTVDADGITVPTWPWSRRVCRIKFRDLTDASIRTYHGQRMLLLRYAGGKANVVASKLPHPHDLDDIIAAMKAAVARQ